MVKHLKTLPLILDKENPDMFKDENNLMPLEILVANHQNIDLNPRRKQSDRYGVSWDNKMIVDKELNELGKIFYKDGKWFKTITIRPAPYDEIKEVFI